MYALLSLLLIISLSLLVVRVGSVALRMTGVSPEVASFQALSAFSGAGFTTDEAEAIVEYPSRRAVVKTLMRLGSAGAVTAISSLVLSFMDPTTRLRRLVVLLGFLVALVALARSQWFNDLLTPVIEAMLNRISELELRDYTSLLDLHQDYRVADLEIDEGD